jgi:predicted metalloprotease with PDZ domain
MTTSVNTQRNIEYHINASNAHAHTFDVNLIIHSPNPEGQELWLPSWIPGSYMIRDFSRNITSMQATDKDGNKLGLTKISKNNWKTAPYSEQLRISYQVYAWDLSVRSAHFDQTHAYFNGTSVFLAVKDQEQQAVSVTINADNQYSQNWRIATSMTRAENTERFEFGEYLAEDYDELIDHPVEMAEFDCESFIANGIEHFVVFTGKHQCDYSRLNSDLKKICETQINFFGEAPFKEYWFMTMVTGNDYGGLEHRASTSLVCPREDLPTINTETIDDKYLNFLTLCSHEYFHSWNIKRIKPEVFLPYQLNQESYTQQLWAFEGITSYYEALMLHKADLMTAEEFLAYFSQKITAVLRNPGRLKQTVTESSFDAWTKFYKQDENAFNAIVNYYAKGAMVALALDLTLRQSTDHKESLDTLMKRLWLDFGKPNIGVKENDIERLANELSGIDLTDFFDQWLYSTEHNEVGELVSHFGIDYQLGFSTNLMEKGGDSSKCSSIAKCVLGARTTPANNDVKLTHLINGACAMNAGLSGLDIIIAINDLKVTNANIESTIANFKEGETFTITAFRRDELMTFEAIATLANANICTLKIDNKEKLAGWLTA